MKKISIVFVLMMLIILSACSKNKLFDINHETYSSDKLEFVTEKESYSSNDTVIRYSITNIGADENCIAGDDNCFELHKLVDGEWKRVGAKIDHSWTLEGLILYPNQTEVREIILEEFFHLPLEKGTYRIAVEDLVSNTFEIS
ncbi:MAG: hypothetical protein IJZ75_00930 [Clostridia bacterium]|nr:hypothetical protein [Clostridia bacterium]